MVCAVVTDVSASLSTLSARRSDMFSTLFYYANWHFIYSGQSYFATFEGVSPLRHTWSLAIEEQFYLLWPVILIGVLWLMPRWKRALPWILGGAAVASAVAMAALYEPLRPERAYYGTDTRVHALLVGAILAALIRSRPGIVTGPRVQRIAAWVAPAAAIVVGIALFEVDGLDRFYYRGGSLLFAIAVALGIWALEARPRLFLGAVLSVPAVVWVGRISYGVYLWHWPLIVWINDSERFSEWSTGARQAIEIVLTFVIATASFYVIERPIRYGMVPWVRKYGARFAVMAVVAVAGTAVLTFHSTQISSKSIARQVNDTSDEQCPPGSPVAAGLYAWCSRTEPAHPDSAVVAVVGDSTSRSLDPGLRKVASRRGWRYIQAGQNGCSITPEVLVGTTEPAELALKEQCPQHLPAMIDDIISTQDPDVWIVADWTTVGLLVLPDGRTLNNDDPARVPILVASMRAMLEHLTSAGGQVVYLATAPNAEPVECTTDPTDKCDDPVHSLDHPIWKLVHQIEREATADLPRVAYVSVNDILCRDNGRCPALVRGELARYDGVHYTTAFSRRIIPIIVARAKRAGISFDRGRP